jgi:hypothetical protein
MEGIYNFYFSSNFAAVYFIGVDFDKGFRWWSSVTRASVGGQTILVFELIRLVHEEAQVNLQQ